jgi:hypothetical protein
MKFLLQNSLFANARFYSHFRLQRVQSKQILTLSGRKATKRNIQRLLVDRLPQKVGQNDRVIIYFSGHGKDESVGGREVGYLIPVKNYLLRGAIAIMSSSSRAPGELKP